jgi:hypothetical protein
MSTAQKISSMGWSHGCIPLKDGETIVWVADAVKSGTRHAVEATSEQEALERLLYEITDGDLAAVD